MLAEVKKGRKNVQSTIGLLTSRIRAAATTSQKDPQALNAKQEAFCQEITKGSLKYEAARQSGYQGDDKVLSVTAAKLLGMSKVKMRIAELQTASALDVKMTRDGHLLALAELRDKATATKQYAAAIRAEELRGKISGLHRDDADEQKAIADRVSKLPVDEQLALVRAALQRIQTMTGTHISLKLDRQIADVTPEPAKESMKEEAPEPPPTFTDKHEFDGIFTDKHEFDGIDDEPVGMAAQRTNAEEIE